MDNKQNPKDTREKILYASEELFAQHGFDGARVDEIAKKAGVNKALLYYYFGSKENILDELLKINIDDISEKKMKMMNKISQKKSQITEEDFYRLFDYSFELAKKKSNFMKILITEMLKKGEEDGAIYDLFYPKLQEFSPELDELNIKIEEPIEIILSSFFLGLLPISMYIAMAEKIAKHYGYDEKELDNKFAHIYKKFYINPTLEYYSKKDQCS